MLGGLRAHLVAVLGQSRDRELMFAPFACRGRLRNLLADCCTIGRYCVTITRQ